MCQSVARRNLGFLVLVGPFLARRRRVHNVNRERLDVPIYLVFDRVTALFGDLELNDAAQNDARQPILASTLGPFHPEFASHFAHEIAPGVADAVDRAVSHLGIEFFMGRE